MSDLQAFAILCMLGASSAAAWLAFGEWYWDWQRMRHHLPASTADVAETIDRLDFENERALWNARKNRRKA